MIHGAHIIIYSKDSEADRAFFRDVLKYESVDAGHGWLIFALPPAEVALDLGGIDCVTAIVAGTILDVADLRFARASVSQRPRSSSSVQIVFTTCMFSRSASPPMLYTSPTRPISSTRRIAVQ